MTNLELCKSYFPNLSWEILGERSRYVGTYKGTLTGLDGSLLARVTPVGCHVAYTIPIGPLSGLTMFSTPNEQDWTLTACLERIKTEWRQFSDLNALATSGGVEVQK